MTCSEAAKIGHMKSREPFLEMGRKLCLEMGKPIPAAFNPPLILTRSDRVR